MTSGEFRQIRRQLGLTQAELAALMGTYAQHISRIESGDRAPTRQQAAALRLVELLADCEASEKKIIRAGKKPETARNQN